MRGFLRMFNDVRWIGVLLGMLVLALAFQARSTLRTRALATEKSRQVEMARLEIGALTRTLEAEHASRSESAIRDGRGPGGIGSEWDTWLFDGPTAAQSALELAFAVEQSGFHHLRYEGRPVTSVSRFPTESADETEMENAAPRLPVRGTYEFMEWPIQIYVESDYASLLKLIGRLTSSQPAFSIRDWRLESVRDEHGDVTDGLSLHGELATFWLTES